MPEHGGWISPNLIVIWELRVAGLGGTGSDCMVFVLLYKYKILLYKMDYRVNWFDLNSDKLIRKPLIKCKDLI